jgi:diguanylate cyclase (GGDEF)-like protein
MIKDQAAPSSKSPRSADSLTQVLDQSEYVRNIVEECADDLSSVNAGLKRELQDGDVSPGVESALEKSEAVETKVQDASEALSLVNDELKEEVKARHVLDAQLATAIKQGDEARHASLHDPLTGLPNRLLINDRLNQALTIAKRDQQYVALMFLDLDRFKNINDSLGHEIGDLLLKRVAERLTNCLRSSDTISRQGGDEFMILLPEIVDHYAPAEVAEKLLSACIEPFDITGHEIRVSISIAIAVYPDDGENVETLTKSADSAMYHAKALGRNNYQFFTQSMNERVKQLTELEHNLRLAIENNEFLL